MLVGKHDLIFLSEHIFHRLKVLATAYSFPSNKQLARKLLAAAFLLAVYWMGNFPTN
jgi:hypothetical protein